MQDANKLSEFRDYLAVGAATLNLPLTSEQIILCEKFAQIILDENTRQNLTRIVTPEGMAIKHFLDSLTVFLALPTLKQNASVLDVGTGLGFPGMALKIYRPDISLALLDSLRKRLIFLGSAASELNLEVKIVHARGEDAQKLPEHKGKYDLVTARAVAALPKLLEWCGPFVKKGGYFVAMKSKSVLETEEIKESQTMQDKLGLKLIQTLNITLPDTENSERVLLVYQR